MSQGTMDKPVSEKLGDWFEERLELSALAKFFKKKTVPMHRHSIWYYFGGMTLFFFAVQVITGILLMLYYRPTTDGAFESVKFIVTQVRFGWLVRSIHSWSANLMIASIFVHMFSTFRRCWRSGRSWAGRHHGCRDNWHRRERRNPFPPGASGRGRRSYIFLADRWR